METLVKPTKVIARSEATRQSHSKKIGTLLSLQIISDYFNKPQATPALAADDSACARKRPALACRHERFTGIGDNQQNAGTPGRNILPPHLPDLFPKRGKERPAHLLKLLEKLAAPDTTKRSQSEKTFPIAQFRFSTTGEIPTRQPANYFSCGICRSAGRNDPAFQIPRPYPPGPAAGTAPGSGCSKCGN